MALCYARLFCRRSFDVGNFRSLYTIRSSTIKQNAMSTPKALAVRTAGTTACETDVERNTRLKRPLSPHLTIYNFELPAILSITHRATGMILATYAMSIGLGTLFIPGGIPCVIASVHALHLPIPILFISKTLLALPATYHFFNGIRHLAWDLGMFLTIKKVYSTGYIVTAISLVSAIALAGCSFG